MIALRRTSGWATSISLCLRSEGTRPFWSPNDVEGETITEVYGYFDTAAVLELVGSS